MAVNFFNNAEGGTDGSTVTFGNSGGGSGNGFSIVAANTGTINYTSDQRFDGSLSYAISPGSASSSNFTVNLGTNSIISARFYTMFTAVPTAAFQLTRFTSNGITMGNLLYNGSSRFVTQINGASVGTGAITAPLNTWLRIEISVRAETGSGGNGLVSNMVFVGNEITNPLYYYVNTNALTGFNDAQQFGVGKITNSGDWPTAYFDAIAVRDAPYIGPLQFSSAVSWLGA